MNGKDIVRFPERLMSARMHFDINQMSFSLQLRCGSQVATIQREGASLIITPHELDRWAGEPDKVQTLEELWKFLEQGIRE